MATEVLFANNATSKLALGISSTDTSMSVIEGTGVLFPDAKEGISHFYCTLIDLDGYIEIVKVTNRSTDTFTIIRGIENLPPRMFPTGAVVQQRVTTQGLYDLKQEAIDIAENAVDIANEAKQDVQDLANLPRTITLTGDATGGPVTFTNTQNISIPVTVASLGGTKFNRQVKTTSGSMTAPVTGMYRIQGCGGGGAGGGTLGNGGLQGQDTTLSVNNNLIFTATRGSGGGAGTGSTRSSGAGGGGGAGKVGDIQAYITAGSTISWTIGIGGSPSSTSTTPTGPEAGRNGLAPSTYSIGSPGTGAGGAGNGGITYNNQYTPAGSGGNGGINGLGFGGGGGGAGANAAPGGIAGLGGNGAEGGADGNDGSTSFTTLRLGGKGGDGCIILEWISKE